MNIQHQAILSLNTRVRRLRYLYKIIDLTSDSGVSRQLLVNQVLDYGFSKALYDEIATTISEPFSGHLFENVSRSYEWNIEQRGKRSSSNAARAP